MYKTYLPIPPTANNLFPTNRYGRRFPSPRYESWKKDAARCFQGIERTINGKVHAIYEYSFPDNRKRDLANFEKAISDFLADNGVIEDDSQIDHLELKRINKSIPGVYIEIRWLS